MSSGGAALRAAAPISSARAEASRRNGAKSRGPKTPEGKARSAQNALKHGMRAQKYVVLPEEDGAEFEALEAALTLELAPQGVLQSILVGRIACAAWRLDRAERIEVELFAERLLAIRDGGVGLALIRDGNSTRSFETLLRYRGAALAELMRSLRTLKALQAEQAAPPVEDSSAALALAAAGGRPATRATLSQRPEPNEPERRGALRLDHVMPDPPAAAHTLHEAAAPWSPRRPDPEHLPNEPERHPVRGPQCETARPPAPAR
ncbi:MAG: hypothetical protein ACREIR_08580 [Geminicoccaceae bacterium]